MEGKKLPWQSEKVWLAVLGMAALVLLSIYGQLDLEAGHVVAIIAALIGGQALEGFAAGLRRPPE